MEQNSTDSHWIELEERGVELWGQLFRRHTGQDFDETTIRLGSEAMTEIATELASSNKENPDSYGFLTKLIRVSRLAPLELGIQRLREKHLTFSDILLENQPVTPYSFLSYLRVENDLQKRHQLLLRLIRGHPECDEAEEEHRSTQRSLAQEFGVSPLDDFLAAEGLQVEQYRDLLTQMGKGMRESFVKRFAENRDAVLRGRQGEAWEDFVTLYLNRWSQHLDEKVAGIDGVECVTRTARGMGFSVGSIQMDLVDRPKKVPGASAWAIRIPKDVRVTVKPVGGATDLVTLWHEMGHALHFVTIDANLPYHVREGFSHGVAETFSFWMESLLSDPTYVQQELRLSETLATEIDRFERLVESTFATVLSAIALAVVDYWVEGPLTREELGDRAVNYLLRFTGIDFPREYVRIMPFARVLNPNVLGYPVACARLGHLLKALEAHDREWWRSSSAADFVRQFMTGGRKAGFPASMFDTHPFVDRYGGA